MSFNDKINQLKLYINGSKIDKKEAFKNKINILYFEGENFGDVLSPIIIEYMLKQKGLDLESETKKKYQFLSALGSLLYYKPYLKKTMWGTGSFNRNPYTKKNKCFAKLDIRCLRGPLTEKHLLKSGVLMKPIGIYGDPGLLMPLIYSSAKEKKYDVSIIPHWKENLNTEHHIISMKTKDWKKTIDEICASKLVISSSLHGIIIAEAYGVPAIWLHNDESDQEEHKYYDYYYSTGRNNPPLVSSIEEGLKLTVPSIPKLDNIVENLLKSFPYDLWK
ncbi:MAG: polysaccharide pyruvyl transferase family protein [Bacilli bacterium]|nr:polysaccharide pyruvyl transferase family protein [Bacilli bacterium]